MILDKAGIDNIILNNPNKAIVAAGQKYNVEMRKHFYGERLDTTLTTIDGFEKPSLNQLRIKYAKSNRDLLNRLARPIDKVFSARGGSVYYNLPETQERKARILVQDVKGGMSAKKWIENYWRKHYMDDPYGLVFMEIAEQPKATLLYSQGKSAVYPTYKSIQCVYDYQPTGNRLEYVCFKVNNAEKKASGFKDEDVIYRLVDDSMDYWIKKDGDLVSIIESHSYPNYFGYVPGITNSDIPDPNLEGGHLSLFDDVLELANNFLMKGSIKLTHEFLFAFPKYWEYADDCKHCAGTGYEPNSEDELCKECKGSKKSIMSKVSDAKVLNWPQDKETPIVTPNVAGFVSPDKIFYDIATHDLQLMEDLMTFTLWGATSSQKAQGMATDAAGPKTATEITNELKPQSDRLQPITECAEGVHKFVIDSLIKIQVNPSYQGASVNYGKRYMIESPDVLWEKYSKARTAGAAMSVLDDLLLEYYEAKYNSDPVKLAIQAKLMKVEPFVHLTVTQLKALNPGEEDYKAKLYFGEWLSTVNDAILISTTTEQLREMMITATSTRELAAPETKMLPAA